MREKKNNKSLISNAKNLRKNMTKEENHLWYDYLKNLPVKVVRQKILGKYIADFYCASLNVVIELDGSQHFTKDGLEYDKSRTEFLKKYGIRVIRIANNEINNNFEGVCEFLDTVFK